MASGEVPHERCRRRWEDSNKIDAKEIGWTGFNCLGLVHWLDLMNTIMNPRVP